ncbi:MAG: lysophospholipid transporter LplT [Betaproteobacteria bacterium]|nr:lysophospholipid transporter LplT [Betaproteobacteria bacterium]
MPKGFYALIFSQFVSALADNALLLLAIALLQGQGYAPFWIPLLKLLFTFSYVVFGPWVGAIADTWPKHKILMQANTVKGVACLGLLAGVNPIAAYALTGLGAALYSPAKYGWITEMVDPDKLLKANAWIEVTTVCAALFGVMMGGWLVSESWLHLSGVQQFTHVLPVDTALPVSLLVVCTMYGMSAFFTHFVPASNKLYAKTLWTVPTVWQHFCQDHAKLWRDPLGFISLSVTTLFWGVSACMQLLVLAWAQTMLQLNLSQAAYLQASTAIGVIMGAMAAGRWVKLQHATAVLGVGVAMGLVLPLMVWITQWPTALGLTLVMGGFGGFLVVPMNALLQSRGAQLLSAGRSISVQNTCENSSILLMLGLYSFLTFIGCSLSVVVIGMAICVAVGMALLTFQSAKYTANANLSGA